MLKLGMHWDEDGKIFLHIIARLIVCMKPSHSFPIRKIPRNPHYTTNPYTV